MKSIALTILAALSSINGGLAQDLVASELYINTGEKVKFEDMILDMANSDMVFFGEYHTNPISHWMQIEMAKSLYEIKGDSLFFGAEMFERGNQLVLNEYLAGFYPEKKMLPEITQLWKNYKTDYKPLVEFAKDKKLRFIASNIPRRYASMISKGGLAILDTLSPEARAFIAPDLVADFDPTLKAYAEMSTKMGHHVPENMLDIQAAQAAKDATMAHFSLMNFQKGDLYFHINGSYHSDNRQGIVWWILKNRPELNIKIITTVEKSEWDNMNEEDRANIANYIIVVADNMTQTSR